MPKSTPSPWLMISCALRGAAIGLVVWGIFALSRDYAGRVVDEALAQATTDLNGVEVLGSIIIMALQIAVPASLLAGLVLAWILRIRRPWAVPFLGFLLGCPLFLVGSRLIPDRPVPGWVSATVLGLSFAGAALVPPNGRRMIPDLTPAAPADARMSEVDTSAQAPRAVVTLTLEELRGSTRERAELIDEGP